jgi:ABC-type polysaccharide/polyol phosphate transport system ATPase subunit
MSADDEVIVFEDVVKRYRLGVERSNLRAAVPWIPHDPGTNVPTVTAIDHLDLTIRQSESVGIIGNNGTGKSTLLKLIAGVVSPTSGTVRTRGRIASIIELGVGFHNDLTGRENLVFTGALMGMSAAEMKRREDDIIDFSGISRAIDTPVKRYSSGMLARLGFAIATHVDADVILVDEVLAVGDIDFQRLSLERLENLILDGVTTVLVSHNLAAVAHLCNRVMRLDRGRLVADDEPEKVVLEYGGRMAIVHAGLGKVPVRLRELKVRPREIHPSEPFDLEAVIEVERPMPRGRLRLVLRPTAELIAAHTSSEITAELELPQLLDVPVPPDMLREEGTWVLKGHVDGYPMFPGAYTFSLELMEDPHNEVLDAAACQVMVPGAVPTARAAQLPVSWSMDLDAV